MPRYRVSDPFGTKRVGPRRRSSSSSTRTPPVADGEDLADRLRAAMAARAEGTPDTELEATTAGEIHAVREDTGEPIGSVPLTVGQVLDHAGPMLEEGEHTGEAVAGERIQIAGDTLIEPSHTLELSELPDLELDEFTIGAGMLPPEAAIGDAVVVVGPPDETGNVLGELAHVAGFGSDGSEGLVTLRWGIPDGGIDEPLEAAQVPQDGLEAGSGADVPPAPLEAPSEPQGQQDGTISAVDAAEILNVDPAEVRRRCREGELAATKDAEGAWRIDPAELTA